MKKIISSLLIFTFLVLLSVSSFARVLKIVPSFAKFAKQIEPVITHTAIETVSIVDRILSAKISVNFGSFKDKIATAKIKYYVDGKIDEIKFEPDKKGTKILNDEEFFITLPNFVDTNSNVNYQIEINFSNEFGTILKTVAFPSTTTYQYTTIVSTVSANILATTGGSMEFGSGNQQYPNTKVEIGPNVLSTDAKIIIKQLPVDILNLTEQEQLIALYQIYSVPENLELLYPIRLTLFYGINTEEKEFGLKFKLDDKAEWKKINVSEIDLDKKIVVSNVSSLGYYAVFKPGILPDNEYRPNKRVVVKSRDVFKFNNLREGDSIKIFTVNGKKIRDIKSGDAEGFKWDGRKNDGSFAKSGIYVYQIKVNGKTISGTIVFVK